MTTSFNLGDRAAVIDEALSGVVRKIDGNIVTIETKDGFLLNFKVSELVLIDRSNTMDNNIFESDIPNAILEKEIPRRKTVRSAKPKDRFKAALEVDLHIHKLVTSSKGMTNYDILNLQLKTAQQQLEFAIRKRMQRIIFIHGLGEGVLKLELETLFRRYDNIKYYDADFKTYGFGATEVYIYQNKI